MKEQSAQRRLRMGTGDSDRSPDNSKKTDEWGRAGLDSGSDAGLAGRTRTEPSTS